MKELKTLGIDIRDYVNKINLVCSEQKCMFYYYNKAYLMNMLVYQCTHGNVYKRTIRKPGWFKLIVLEVRVIATCYFLIQFILLSDAEGMHVGIFENISVFVFMHACMLRKNIWSMFDNCLVWLQFHLWYLQTFHIFV